MKKFIAILAVLGLMITSGGMVLADGQPDDILQCTCECIYCCTTVPPDPDVADVVEPRYGFTEQEITWLALLLCGSGTKDGDGEYDIDFQKEVNYFEVSKVLCVVMNRVRDDRFPNTVEGVIFAKNQFLAMSYNQYKTPSDKAIEVVREWCTAYDTYDDGAQSIPENHCWYGGNGYTNTTRSRY